MPKITGRNLTGLFFNRPITVALLWHTWAPLLKPEWSPSQTSTTFHATSYNFHVVWNVALVWPPCCIVLYSVVSCCMKFDCDQAFLLNKRCTIQHFFCFLGCCMMLYSFSHPMQLCCEYFWRNVVLCCTNWCIRLATLLLNMIKQHATMYNKCCMIFCEMLYSFGRGLSWWNCDWQRSSITWWAHQLSSRF